MGSILQNKKDYPSIVSFLRRWRDLNCPPRNIVVHCPSLCSLHALLISRSFGLPPPATGSGRPLLPRHCGASGSFFTKEKRLPFLIAFSITEMEGFELPTSKYSRALSFALLSPCTPYFSQFRAPSPCHWQRSPSTPAPLWRFGFFFHKRKKATIFDSLFHYGDGGI